MPLIALDILEEKVKELLVVVEHLKEENARLRSEAGRASGDTVPPELKYELESLRKTAEKYKNDRNFLFSKITGILKQLEDMTAGGENG
jgi:hypothetical protein